jgi:hypothetical protein
MSKIEYDKSTHRELVDEIAKIIEDKDSGAVFTALTVLVGNAGYFHGLDFEQFMDLVERNTFLVYSEQREENSVVLH